MRLRNRRLPNFVLTVEVMKIPLSLQYNPSPGMDPQLPSQASRRSIVGPLPSASSPTVSARVQQFGGDAAKLPRPSPKHAGAAGSGSLAQVSSVLQQNMSTPLQRISHGSSYMQAQIDEAVRGEWGHVGWLMVLGRFPDSQEIWPSSVLAWDLCA